MTAMSLEAELMQLRGQLEALSSRVEPAAVAEGAHGKGLLGLDAETAKKVAAALELPELSSQLGALLKSLGRDFQESKPGPLVASFLAGVLVGRLMAR